MSDTHNQLAALRALRDATADSMQRAALDAAIAALEGQRLASLVDMQGAQAGDISIGDVAGGAMAKVGGDLSQGSVNLSGDARLNGVAVGVNLGRVVLGRDPEEDERRRLAWYLARLANKLYRLPLRGVEEHLDQGQGVALPQVYVSLAVWSNAWALRGTPGEVASRFQGENLQRPLKPEYDPDVALPDQAVVLWSREAENNERQVTGYQVDQFRRVQLNEHEQIVLYRASLVSETMQWRRRRKVASERTNHLVLLGDPGSGKSTVIRHLAWALARRGLDQYDAESSLPGWEDDHRLLPIILPLRALAGRIAVEGANERTVFAALREEMHALCMQQIDDLLTAALDRGTALLLFDGLDEVPLEGQPGIVASRAVTLRAVRDFVQLCDRTMALLTCRTRAFNEARRDDLGWIVERLRPLTLGQVRHFVPAWYSELAAKGQLISHQSERLSAVLIDTIASSPKLRSMAENPLLLTMMALVLLNKGELPRDRPQLYERILDLLLGQWDQVRDGQSLAEAVGLSDWGSERFRPLLDQLSYQAHLAGSSEDGRGRLARGKFRDALIAFFEAAQVPEPWGAARRWLEYVEQRSGLLVPDGPSSYMFAHLTLQEHCAGRHIALSSDDPVALAMGHRHDDRWREPIFLGAGLMRHAELNSLLADLVDPEGKAHERWYRDLILAAEIGKDRDWSYLRTRPMMKVERIQRELRSGLVALLADKAQLLPIAERVRAGVLLGGLGDPRYPVTIEEWRRELGQADAGAAGSYFCRVEAKDYVIGSKDDPDASEDEQPQHIVSFEQSFFIARYPITNDQWLMWVEQGDGLSSFLADDTDLNSPNQPAVLITWEMANEFCAWLSAQLAAALPAGYILRLPTEQEWEAAARGGDARCYPWGDDWREDHAATLEGREARGLPEPVPVGCYPAGAAPCGAVDMVGNVWEWTASVWQSYPGGRAALTENEYRAVRGRGYRDKRNHCRCGARFMLRPDDNRVTVYLGFRVVLAPALAQRL